MAVCDRQDLFYLGQFNERLNFMLSFYPFVVIFQRLRNRLYAQCLKIACLHWKIQIWNFSKLEFKTTHSHVRKLKAWNRIEWNSSPSSNLFILNLCQFARIIALKAFSFWGCNQKERYILGRLLNTFRTNFSASYPAFILFVGEKTTQSAIKKLFKIGSIWCLVHMNSFSLDCAFRWSKWDRAGFAVKRKAFLPTRYGQRLNASSKWASRTSLTHPSSPRGPNRRASIHE